MAGGVFGARLGDFIAAEHTIAAYEYTEDAAASNGRASSSAYRPVLLQGYASILAEVARVVIDQRLPMPKTLIGVYSTAEVLDDSQRRLMQQAFGCKVFNQYGSREIPNIACECRLGNMHVFTDMVYLESVKLDDEDRLLVTSLTNRLMPMIRYDIGDSGRLLEGECGCGLPFPLMEMGMCRQNDLIRTRGGKTVHPSYFNRLLYGHDADPAIPVGAARLRPDRAEPGRPAAAGQRNTGSAGSRHPPQCGCADGAGGERPG